MKKFLTACLIGTIGLGCITSAYIKINSTKNQDTQTEKETNAASKLQKLTNKDNVKEGGEPSKIYNSESYLKEDNNSIDTMQDLLDNDTIREYGIPNNTYTYESYPD